MLYAANTAAIPFLSGQSTNVAPQGGLKSPLESASALDKGRHSPEAPKRAGHLIPVPTTSVHGCQRDTQPCSTQTGPTKRFFQASSLPAQCPAQKLTLSEPEPFRISLSIRLFEFRTESKGGITHDCKLLPMSYSIAYCTSSVQ